MRIKKDYILYSLLDLPFLETNREHIKDIFLVLEKKFGLKKYSKQRFVDLGAGDGRIVIYVGLNYGILSIGYEINPDLITETKEQIKLMKKKKFYKNKYFKKVKIREVDLFVQNLKNFDFIYIYSLPTMQKFLKMVFKTAKNEAVFISYRYPLTHFESYLKLEYKFKHRTKNKEIFTYFYRKVKKSRE